MFFPPADGGVLATGPTQPRGDEGVHRVGMLAAIAHDLHTYLTRPPLRAEFMADEAHRAKAARARAPRTEHAEVPPWVFAPLEFTSKI